MVSDTCVIDDNLKKNRHKDARTRRVYAHSGNASRTSVASLLMAHGDRSQMHARIVRTSTCASKSAKCCSSRVSNKWFAYAASHMLEWHAGAACGIGLCGRLLTDREAGYGLSIILANSEDSWAAILGFRVGFSVSEACAVSPQVLRGAHALCGE
jgi:hypothetical protein